MIIEADAKNENRREFNYWLFASIEKKLRVTKKVRITQSKSHRHAEVFAANRHTKPDSRHAELDSASTDSHLSRRF